MITVVSIGIQTVSLPSRFLPAGLVIVRKRPVVFREGDPALVGLFGMMRAGDLPEWFRGQTWTEPELIIRTRDGKIHPEYSAVKLAVWMRISCTASGGGGWSGRDLQQELGPGVVAPAGVALGARRALHEEAAAVRAELHGVVEQIEQQAAERHPELKREGFAAKMAEGLTGMPMNTIVLEIDKYYLQNPDDLQAPVMEVIWDELVKPRIKTGIANLPLD